MRFERTTAVVIEEAVKNNIDGVPWKPSEMPEGRRQRGRPEGRLDTPLEVVAVALRKVRGNITKAAKLLGLNRSALWTRISRHTELQEIIYHETERWIDEIEEVAFKRGKKSDEMARFVLKTKGKYRGWSERLEIGGPGGGPIEITVTYDADGNGVRMGQAKALEPAGLVVEGEIDQDNDMSQGEERSLVLANPDDCPEGQKEGAGDLLSGDREEGPSEGPEGQADGPEE